MIFLIIMVIIVAIAFIAGIWMVVEGCKIEDPGVIIVASVLTISSFIFLVILAKEITTQYKERTIKVNNIERIDTLYRNKEIVGYEIIVKKESVNGTERSNKNLKGDTEMEKQ